MQTQSLSQQLALFGTAICTLFWQSPRVLAQDADPEPPPAEAESKPTSAFAFYEVRTINKRVLAVSKVPLPGFERDVLVYLVDRAVSTVVGRARILKASVSPSTSQHFLELNVLEPSVPPGIGWSRHLVVLKDSLSTSLAHLKWANGVTKPADLSLDAGGSSSGKGTSDSATSPGSGAAFSSQVEPSNSLVALEFETSSLPYHHLDSLTGIKGNIQGTQNEVSLSVFPPKSANLEWINWFGAGFALNQGSQVSFEGQNAVNKTREEFEISRDEMRADLWVRPNFPLRAVSRVGLRVTVWRSAAQELKSKNTASKVTLKDASPSVHFSFESNPFSRVVLGAFAEVPLKKKLSVTTVNSTGQSSTSSADLAAYSFGVEAGFRENFGSDRHKFVLDAIAGSRYAWEILETQNAKETSPKIFSPFGRIGVSYLLK